MYTYCARSGTGRAVTANAVAPAAATAAAFRVDWAGILMTNFS